MSKRSIVMSYGLSALALLCTADFDHVLAAAQDRGSQGRPSSAPSRPSAPPPSRPSPPPQSRPSPPPQSRPSPPPQSRPSPPPQSRPSPPPESRPSAPPPVSRPAPSNPPPVVTRPQPAEPRASAPAPRTREGAPREDAPRRDAPRYEPRPEAPRAGTDADTPRSTPRDEGQQGPRYLPPDNSGRVYDSGRRPSSGSDRGGSSSEPRGWQPEGSTSTYEFERRTPRTPVPSLSGTPRVESNVPGTPRPGLSSRTGRSPDLDGPRRTQPAEGEGLVRLPRSEVTRESILNRYRGRSAESGSDPITRPRSDSDLSRARGARLDAVDRSTLEAERARAARERSAPVAPRGSVEAARRERESLDRLERLRREAPERAKPIEDAGGALSHAADRAAQVSIGIGVGVATGVYAGWFWEPSCSPHHRRPYSHWAATFGWPWNAYGSYWSWCWPYGWSASWYHHGFGFAWNSCGYYPNSWGYAYPYSYAYWSPSPVYYTTVVNDCSHGATPAVVYDQPIAEGEGVIASADDRATPAPDPRGETAPEVKAALVRGAADYLALGDDAFRQGRYSDAVHHYARTVEYAPDDGVLYLLLADALFATGDYHYAAFALRRAIELEPTILDHVVDKHGFYGNPLEFDTQIALAEQYLNEHFLDEDARLVLAANYLFANRPAQCADLLRNPFSQSVLESTAGRRLLERADELRKAASPTGR